MFWKEIKAKMIRLPFEEKVIATSSLALLMSCFLPWSRWMDTLDKTKVINMNALQGLGYILGYCVLILAVFSLILTLADVLEFNLPKFLNNPKRIYQYIGGQAVFIITIALLIYTQMSIEFSWVEVRFGLYLSLMSAMFITAFGYIFIQKIKEAEAKRKAHEIFEHNYKNTINLQPEMDASLDPPPRNDIKDIYRQAVSTVNQEIFHKRGRDSEVKNVSATSSLFIDEGVK
jgi:hypothetical protein